MARKSEEVPTVRRRVQVTAMLTAAESAEAAASLAETPSSVRAGSQVEKRPPPRAGAAAESRPATPPATWESEASPRPGVASLAEPRSSAAGSSRYWTPAKVPPEAPGRGAAPVADGSRRERAPAEAAAAPGPGTVALRPRRRDPVPPPSGRAADDPRTVTAKLQRNLEAKRESIDRIALFTASFLAARARELLGGLVPSAAAAAQALAEQVAGLDSMMRKARAARAFGERVDAPQRVKGLLHEAHGLQGELIARLPPYLVAGTHRVASPERPVGGPARTALLDRLIREASR